MQQIVNPCPSLNCSSDIIFYNMVGNFMPPEWRNLTTPTGKVLSKTARQLLSLIVSCLQPSTGEDLKEFQESYYFFESTIGVCQRRVRQCLLELQEGGFISLYSTTVIKHHVKCRNILCIKLVKKFQPYLQKVSSEPEENFMSTRKDFQPHYIIDNNISKLESRSSESGSEKNNFEEKQLPRTEVNTSTNWLKKTADKAKTWCKGKKLAEFHPLTEEESEVLRVRSRRDFNLNFINKLLIKLAEQYPNHSFYSTKSVLNYMAKALAYEMRETVKVYNEGFRFKADDTILKQEQYLQNIEYSKDTSQTAQLKRKIAAIFDRDTAYLLLTSCKFFEPQQGCFQLKLLKDITIVEYTQANLLEQIQAVYGEKINKLEIMPLAQASHINQTNIADKETYNALSCLDPKSIWFKVRKSLIDWYGINIDKAWFSKLEVIEEDTTCRKVTLKPSTAFIGDWLKSNYESALRQAFKAQDFNFEIAKP